GSVTIYSPSNKSQSQRQVMSIAPNNTLDGLEHLGPAVAAGTTSGDHFPAQARDLEDEVDRLTTSLLEKFEEISLIHELVEQMQLDMDVSDICGPLMERISDCVSADTVAIELLPDDIRGTVLQLYQFGTEIPEKELSAIAELAVAERHTMGAGVSDVVILNRPQTARLSGLRVVVLTIELRGKKLGRLIALRHEDAQEFGTIEVDLLRSTMMMLAMHLINQQQYLELQHMFEGTIRSLVSALDAKDAYTCGHSERVATLAAELASRLGLPSKDVERIRMSGILHDIGKIGVNDAVLQKPGRLTEEEFEEIKKHPVIGFDILKGLRPFRELLPGVRSHHESWDGTGYPDGLEGDQIPRDAQILAVADAFDAMTSDRPYRDGMPIPKVVSIFESGRGQQWAADAVDALLSDVDSLDSFTNH
ncbi:MAG: HD-GYP domain-containing protein, partial [Planctomycetota bacterium]